MTYLPFISILVAVLGVIFTYFGFVVRITNAIATINSTCKGRAKASDCLPQMQVDLAKLTATDEVFWRVLGPSLGEIIHSPLHKRRDQLMDEWLAAPKGKIPESDLRELRDELGQMLDEADAGDSLGMRMVGAMLLARVEAQISAAERQPFINGGI